MDQCAFRVVGRNAMHSGQQKRVMSDQQLRTDAHRLGHGGRDGIDRKQHVIDVVVRVATHQTDGVP
jgi:hypothetical protein